MRRLHESTLRSWVLASLLAAPLLIAAAGGAGADDPEPAGNQGQNAGSSGDAGGGQGEPGGNVAGAVTGSAPEVSGIMGGDGGERVIIIDVRPRADFAKGHLKNAKNLDVRYSDVLRDHVFDMSELGTDKRARIVVYGASASDPAAAAVVRKAQAEGFSNVLWMRGGFAEWVAARLPTTTS